jgi:hypothetical protein
MMPSRISIARGASLAILVFACACGSTPPRIGESTIAGDLIGQVVDDEDGGAWVFEDRSELTELRLLDVREDAGLLRCRVVVRLRGRTGAERAGELVAGYRGQGGEWAFAGVTGTLRTPKNGAR